MLCLHKTASKAQATGQAQGNANLVVNSLLATKRVRRSIGVVVIPPRNVAYNVEERNTVKPDTGKPLNSCAFAGVENQDRTSLVLAKEEGSSRLLTTNETLTSRKATTEKHVEQLLGRYVSLEAVRIVPIFLMRMRRSIVAIFVSVCIVFPPLFFVAEHGECVANS